MGGAFDADTPYDHEHPSALAIYCSDGRFTRAVEELLRRTGHERLDTLTMPGGPALLNQLSASYAEADAVKKAAAFLIAGHGIIEVVLLAHAGCGYYRARRAHDSPEQIRARQIADLRVAAATLRKVEPALSIRLYYADAVDRRVRFEPLELAPAR